VGVEHGYTIDAALVGNRVCRAVAVAIGQDGAVEKVICRDAHDLFRNADSLPHQRKVVRTQTSEEVAHPALLGCDLLVRKGLRIQRRKPGVTLLRGFRGKVRPLDLECAALVDELSIGPAKIPHAGIEDARDGGDLALEGAEVAGGVAAHVPHESAAGGGLLGGDDGVDGGEGERDGLLDEDVPVGG
jgi:hypothetical protein